ncbi:hypothetical protein CR513_34160, partial [Mucuna pruriens]
MTNQSQAKGETLAPQTQQRESSVFQEIMALWRKMSKMRKRNAEDFKTLRRENEELRSQYRRIDTENTITRQQAEAKDAENPNARSQGETNMRLEAEKSYQGRSRLRKHPLIDGIIEPPTCRGVALNLYMHLPPNSIDSFETLMTKFGTRYATSTSYHLTLVALVNLRQEEDESLYSFMEHFLAVVVKIRDLNPKITLHSMIMALKLGLFSNSLCKRPPTSIDKSRARTFEYIQMEKVAEYRDGIRAEHQVAVSRRWEGGTPS